ncbi:flagellar hook-length control protein FliK [Psychrobacillus psychrodurans]|uniref:flagellar hook-length control protein FliK n=1 Tax=Psychrobacillus psychrodurans TaxID=126157 RepID=UPI003D036116
MNIATVVNMGNNIAVQPKGQQQTQVQNNQVFGSVFGQILSSQQVQQPVTPIPDESAENLVEELLTLLGAESLEEAESLLDSKELSIDPKQLKELLNKLLGEKTDTEEEPTGSNVWDLLAGIQEQPSKLTDAIMRSLDGQGPATPVEAKQALEMLKVMQLIGKKSDLTLKQETTLFDTQQLLGNVKETLQKANVTKQLTIEQTMKSVVRQIVVKQVVSQADKVIETKEVTSNVQGQSSINVQTKVQTVSVTLPTEKPAQSEEFVKELQKAMNRAQFGQAGGANRLVLKLNPEHLGSIRIEIIQKDGLLTTKMLASTALGKEMLDSHSSQLRQGLVNQNIQVDKLEITQALQESTRQERNQTFQESFKQQQQEQPETTKEEAEDSSTFVELLKEMEV